MPLVSDAIMVDVNAPSIDTLSDMSMLTCEVILLVPSIVADIPLVFSNSPVMVDELEDDDTNSIDKTNELNTDELELITPSIDISRLICPSVEDTPLTSPPILYSQVKLPDTSLVLPMVLSNDIGPEYISVQMLDQSCCVPSNILATL